VHLLDAIRTLRKEKDMTFEQARDHAIAFFVKKQLPLPEWAKRYAPKE
jgi:hypothetical protein